MDFNNLSEIDILQMQYSILEQLKQKKNSNTTTIEHRIDLSPQLLNPSDDENKSEEEYFAKILSNENASIPREPYEKFILKRFDDGLGNAENDNEYYCRVAWFDNSCPTYKQLSKIIGYTPQRIGNYASKYNWSNIKQCAFDLGYRLGENPRIIQNSFVDNSKIERNNKEYRRYHERVLKRDKVCQCCGNSEDLEVHHPMPFNQYNSLGADTNNGIVLCKECHSKYHTEYGYKRNANAVTLALFLRDYGMNPQQTLDETSENQIKEMSLDELVKNIEEYQEDNRGYCPIEKLVSDCVYWGFNEDRIREQLDLLLEKGVCYKPTFDDIKVIE